MNSYLISDSPLWRLAQCSFTLLLKTRRNHHHSHVRAEALFSMVFVPAQKLSSVVGTLACEQALRGALAGKGRRACYYVSGIRISASKKSMWNTKVITLGMCFSMFVYIRTHFHSHSFPLCTDWWKSDSSVDGESQGYWRWNSSSRDAVTSCPSFSCPTNRVPRRACSQAMWTQASLTEWAYSLGLILLSREGERKWQTTSLQDNISRQLAPNRKTSNLLQTNKLTILMWRIWNNSYLNCGCRWK